jgi:hypothetical protein
MMKKKNFPSLVELIDWCISLMPNQAILPGAKA